MYEFMVEMYNDFLKKNNLTENDIKELFYGKTADLGVIIDGENVRLSAIDKKNGDEILVFGRVTVSEVKNNDEEHIRECVEANAIAVVMFDRLMGEDAEDNPARRKKGFWFEEEVKRLVGSIDYWNDLEEF